MSAMLKKSVSSVQENVSNTLEAESGASRRYKSSDGMPEEGSRRMQVLTLINSHKFEKAMGLVVLVNFVLIIMQVDGEAACHPLPPNFQSFDDCKLALGGSALPWAIWVLLCVYTLELICRLYAEQRAFLKHGWNHLDLFVVVTGWLSETVFDIGTMSSLRIIRTLRLMRLFRVLLAFEELYLLLSGLLSTCKSLVFASGMLFALLTIWSVILVEHVHPVVATIDWEAYGCERCGRGYSSILHSNLSLFQQLVTGDSWGQMNIPVIEEAPWTGLFLMSVVISVSFGLMNLILAVIIQRAEDARESDAFSRALEKDREQTKQINELMSFCALMDGDKSGDIRLEELLGAWRDDADVKALFKVMDIHEEELRTVFKVLDIDGSGEVSYHEFCEEIYKIRTRDVNTMLSFMKIEINDVNKRLTNMESNLHTHMTRMEEHMVLATQGLGLRPEGPAGQQPFADGTDGADDSDPFNEPQDLAAPFGGAAAEPALGLDELLRSIVAGRVEEQVASLVQSLREELKVPRDGADVEAQERKAELLGALSSLSSAVCALKPGGATLRVQLVGDMNGFNGSGSGNGGGAAASPCRPGGNGRSSAASVAAAAAFMERAADPARISSV